MDLDPRIVAFIRHQIQQIQPVFEFQNVNTGVPADQLVTLSSALLSAKKDMSAEKGAGKNS